MVTSFLERITEMNALDCVRLREILILMFLVNWIMYQKVDLVLTIKMYVS